ncbi:hypothetical protein PLANPX_0674 [Lacipirellula parvula]|uniref:Uncharacterized protein n=1 Tax=Lacipirellula parvula TaxID=2650471 RepID=A0A5K7X5E5_9BACT|nr:hypothetical protein PLANPX_0674 [Lacipirellula parvula]
MLTRCSTSVELQLNGDEICEAGYRGAGFHGHRGERLGGTSPRSTQ